MYFSTSLFSFLAFFLPAGKAGFSLGQSNSVAFESGFLMSS
jgi:hypothetical protein